MKHHVIFLACWLLAIPFVYSQEKPTEQRGVSTQLFDNENRLPIKLSYSVRELKRETNDSTYLETDMSYQAEDGTWKSIAVEIRIRGNYRKAKCDFPPLKMKIKKSAARETLFEENRKLKLVLPCLKTPNLNDDLIKEFLAYKIYERVTPYHLKTKMFGMDLTETTGKKSKEYKLLGFFVEDDKDFARRFGGQEVERFTHHRYMDTLTAVQNAFFQYLIGNTDYSMDYLHNEKLFRIKGTIIPVPYDFDMTGLVNPNYAVVSEVQNEKLPISDVTQRLYRGFKCEPEIFQQVREQYLAIKGDVLDILEDHRTLFGNPKEFERARKFILEFFEVMEDDRQFNRQILEQAMEE